MNNYDQAETIDFLAKADTHAGQKVGRIDTHISAIFLVGEAVYKLKKAVTLPFLDFSTLSQREKACKDELVINRRTAPDLYQGVLPVIRQANGNLSLGGEGEAVDWLVVMQRFDEDTLFDRMASTSSLTDDHLKELADAVASLHQKADTCREWGGLEGMRHTIVTNHACFEQFAGKPFALKDAQDLTKYSLAEMEKHADLLEERRKDGHVRQCHGDLHLGNICLFQEQPTIFDAIEFNDNFARIDVFYDLAFMLMDLLARKLDRLASLFFNRYLERIDDVGALPLLPLFISVRAAVRAHVSAAMGKPDLALSYLNQAMTALQQPNKPVLVACGGFSGSGKSRLSRELAPSLGNAPGAIVLRSDVLRKRLAGKSNEDRLGAEFYSGDMTEKVHQTMFKQAEQALTNGNAVILDAVFANERYRHLAEDVARKSGVTFHGFWLEADVKVLKRRVSSRKKNVSDATLEVVEKQQHYDTGVIDWKYLDASGPREDTLKMARECL